MGRLADQRNILSKLTLRRFLNILKVTASYYYSRGTRTARQAGLPISISIEPTTSCNLRCPECPSGLRAFSRPTGMLHPEFFRKTIDELCRDTFYLTFYFQGEPYLNPAFLEMVSYAHRRNLYTSTSTNAHYLDEKRARETVLSGLDRIIISIDGSTQETYEQYRVGGKLHKVIEGTKNLVRMKKELRSATPHIIFQFLVVRPNEHQTEAIRQLGTELGVDEVRFKSAQVYDYENGNDLIPVQEKYARYRKNTDGTFSIKNKLLDHCWKLWSACVITWDGKVVPCCFDKDATHRMGELSQTSFASVWQGPEYDRFRNAVLRSRSEVDICKNCTEGTQVWI